VAVRGHFAWSLGEFLTSHLPASIAADGAFRKELEELPAHRQRQVSRLDDGRFVAEMQRLVQAFRYGLEALAHLLGHCKTVEVVVLTMR
jgi:hypothetical protein